MITEKTTLTITLEGDDTNNFKSMVNKLATKSIGFKGIHNHFEKEEMALLGKLNEKLNKKKDEK